MNQELTEKQKQLVIEIKDEWINQLGNIKLNKDKVQRGIEFMYKEAKLELPKNIIYVSSPLGMQYAYCLLKNINKDSVNNSVLNSVWDSVLNSVLNSVNNSVLNSVEDSVLNSVLNSVWDSVLNSVWDSVNNSVNNSVLNSVRDSVRDSVGDYQHMGARGSVCDWNWVAFHDFFQRIGIELTPKFETFKELCCKSGAYDYLFYEDVAIICKHPEFVKWNDDQPKVLHCDNGPAIQWDDGFKLYAINGVTVTKQIVVKPETLTIKQIQEEENLEVQRIMIERYGPDKYLQEINATVADVDMRGVEGAGPRALMREPNGNQWLVCTDGSTDRVYHLFVPKDIRTCRQAHELLCGFDETLIKAEG